MKSVTLLRLIGIAIIFVASDNVLTGFYYVTNNKDVDLDSTIEDLDIVKKDLYIRRTIREPPIQFSPICKCANCEEDELCGGLWTATRYPPAHIIHSDIDIDIAEAQDKLSTNTNTNKALSYLNLNLHKKMIHIVISHCRKDLHWLSNFTRGFDVASVHVITKCGVPVSGVPKHMNATTTIEVLPNVGRCDHSYAHYITTILDKKMKIKENGNGEDEEKNSVVLFLKDDMSTENLHQGDQMEKSWNDVESMLQVSFSANGFSCGTVISKSSRRSAYHKLGRLFKFKMKVYTSNKKVYADHGDDAPFQSDITDLGSFINILDPGPLPELVQVCYGGIFAASVSNIRKTKSSTWETAEKILSRGDNIVEGHFMERSWGMLLSTHLQQFQIDGLRKCSNGLERGNFVFKGVLKKPADEVKSCELI